MVTYFRKQVRLSAWLVLLVLATILTLQPIASAITPQQRRTYVNRGIAFIDEDCPTNTELDGGTRYQIAWTFLTQKGLSAEAAAGIMGNLEAESGINPFNMQDTAPLPDGPELPTEPGPKGGPIPDSAIRGKYGYGIAQWTLWSSPDPGIPDNRQQNLINYAAETARKTGDMDLQLDFLWKELNENYPAVLTKLQTPGVTLEEASLIFLSKFEIPKPFTSAGTPEQRAAETANRLAKSQAIYDKYKNQTGTPDISSCAITTGPIDLESTDTTHIQCTNGTEDAGEADGYREGQLIRLRLCKVGGTLVNSQLAGSIQQMLTDSAAAGIPLSINGSFRTMEDQIRVYRSWCQRDGIIPTPPPYPRPEEEYRRCPGAAPPGYSNHQQGLALDLECNGSTITRYYPQAQNDPCFQWLLANGIRYHLYEWGKGEERDNVGYEAWHWSVDGG